MPGNPGGPGRPPLSLEARQFRTAAKQEIIEEFKYLWAMTEAELKEVIDPDNSEPMIRKRIAGMILSGDFRELLDRTIGKVKEEIDLNHKGSLHMQVVTMIMEAEGKEIANGDKGKAQIENQKANDKEA